MLKITIISLGALREEYLSQAVAEYEKRLSAFCKIENINLKEEPVQNEERAAEISAALEKESEKILPLIPHGAYKIALCVEGKEIDSETLAKKIDEICLQSGEICFIIGSSHGLSEAVKSACDFRLSVSRLTFPHRLMRVILLEAVYRALSINKGTKYHK